MKDHITVRGQDGKFAAYIARPETVPAPAVVVLQELFGVNKPTCLFRYVVRQFIELRNRASPTRSGMSLNSTRIGTTISSNPVFTILLLSSIICS
jgi:Dienelactone hydrolase family